MHARTNVILAGNRGSRRQSRECRGGENKISNVRSFIILRSEEHVTSFTKDNNAIFSSEKW